MAEHRVRQGECISSIADRSGLFWETIWNHPENAELKSQRTDPNVIRPGDIVFVPDKREKEEAGATEQCHRYRKKGVPAKIKIRLLVNDEPRANKHYTLIVDGVILVEGTTDSDGYVEAPIPPGAKKGKLVVQRDDDNRDVYEFDFGSVDPIDQEEGMRGRLQNLGYSLDQGLDEALRSFQKNEELDVSGSLDEVTKSRLQEKFGQ